MSRASQIEIPEGSVGMSDMTGWAGRCQVRTQSGVLVQELGFEWLDASERLFKVSATAAQVADWPVGSHVYDIELTTPAGQRLSTKKDLLILREDVTK